MERYWTEFGWDSLPELDKKIMRAVLRNSIRESRKTLNLKFKNLEKRLRRVLSAIEYEVRHFGRISPDNINRRDEILGEMKLFINTEDKKK